MVHSTQCPSPTLYFVVSLSVLDTDRWCVCWQSAVLTKITPAQIQLMYLNNLDVAGLLGPNISVSEVSALTRVHQINVDITDDNLVSPQHVVCR